MLGKVRSKLEAISTSSFILSLHNPGHLPVSSPPQPVISKSTPIPEPAHPFTLRQLTQPSPRA